MEILRAEDISMHFGGLGALNNINLHVSKGEILGLIGPNGAGKTTLFNVITGSCHPSRGKIYFKGENISDLRPDVICKKGISRTYQLLRPFLELTLLQNVMVGICFGRKENKGGLKEAERKAMDLLDFIGLQERGKEVAKNLTIAERRYLEIVRAMGTEPELLLLDEIVAGLNPTETLEIIKLIRKIRAKGVTLIMIEHVMKVVMELSDRLVVLHHGNKIGEGSPKAVSSNSSVIQAYLGEGVI